MSALADARLYGIVDLGYVTAGRAPEAAERLLEGGVDILQLRAKDAPKSVVAALAKRIHALSAPLGLPLILNDYPELLRDVPGEGAHVGQDDLTVAEAREAAGRPVIVGKSTHSLAQARAALDGDLDRIARVVHVKGYVNATADFTAIPDVVNGASELLIEIFGEAGYHTRTAMGNVVMPFDVALEVDAVLEVRI